MATPNRSLDLMAVRYVSARIDSDSVDQLAIAGN